MCAVNHTLLWLVQVGILFLLISTGSSKIIIHVFLNTLQHIQINKDLHNLTHTVPETTLFINKVRRAR